MWCEEVLLDPVDSGPRSPPPLPSTCLWVPDTTIIFTPSQLLPSTTTGTPITLTTTPKFPPLHPPLPTPHQLLPLQPMPTPQTPHQPHNIPLPPPQPPHLPQHHFIPRRLIPQLIITLLPLQSFSYRPPTHIRLLSLFHRPRERIKWPIMSHTEI